MGNAFCMSTSPRADVVPFQADRCQEFESKLVDMEKPTATAAAPSQASSPVKRLSKRDNTTATTIERMEGEEELSFFRRLFTVRLLVDLRREQDKRKSKSCNVLLVSAGEESTSSLSPKQERRSSWVELQDGAGEPYFYDLLTREIAWEKPTEGMTW